MSSDLKDDFLSKRKKRIAKSKLTNEEDDDNDNKFTSTNKISYENSAFNDDEANYDENELPPPDILPQSNDIKIESQLSSKETVGKRHREKSRELSRKIKETDPNEVANELGIVRDKIQNVLKTNLEKQLNKVRNELAEADGEQGDTLNRTNKTTDLKIDLTSTTNELNQTARLSTSLRINNLLNQIKVNLIYFLHFFANFSF